MHTRHITIATERLTSTIVHVRAHSGDRREEYAFSMEIHPAMRADEIQDQAMEHLQELRAEIEWSEGFEPDPCALMCWGRLPC